MNTKVPRLGPRPALDGLRAVAIVLVTLNHGWTDRFSGGGVGVDLFFVLSGFLISTLMLEELAASGRVSVAKFLVRRALRLYPALIAVVAASVVVGLALPDEGTAGTGVGARSALFYGTDVLISYLNVATGLLAHTWSLGIEEQFYLLWPWVLPFVVHRWSVKATLIATLALAAVSTLLQVTLVAHQAAGARLYHAPDVHAVALLFGCALALLRVDGMALMRNAKLFSASLAVCAVTLMAMASIHNLKLYYLPAGIAACSLISVVLVAGAVRGDNWLSTVTSHPILVRLGRLSYGIYLWNYLIVHLGEAHLGGHPSGLFWVSTFGVSVGVASLSRRYVEAPALDLKSRFAAVPPAAVFDVSSVRQ